MSSLIEYYPGHRCGLDLGRGLAEVGEQDQDIRRPVYHRYDGRHR